LGLKSRNIPPIIAIPKKMDPTNLNSIFEEYFELFCDLLVAIL
jgi:hypothetical protein